MNLQNELVLLRAIEMSDCPLLLEMINNPEIEQSVLGWSYPVSTEQQKKWIENVQGDGNVRYAIDAGKGIVGVAIISSIDFKNKTANLNIKLPNNERGKGYASAAINLLIEYCFGELNLNCLTANVLEENIKSQKLWEKFGFLRDGILRARVYKNGEYRNVFAYSLLRDEYEKRNRQ